MTKKVLLDELGDLKADHVVEYDAMKQPEIAAYAREELNLMQAPIVFYNDTIWSGFDVDNLKAVTAEIKSLVDQ